MQQMDAEDDFMSQVVSFERRANVLEPSIFVKDEPLLSTETDIFVHDKAMESSKAGTFVDFANSQLHIGRIIPSLTQEEILFSCCPELFIGLLFVETLADNEVLVIKNVVRFSEYSGYMRTFNFLGFYDVNGAQRCSNILVMDAVFEKHFDSQNILRDINKAFLGFSACGTPTISTGQWGCGIFGGDPTLKFIQQVLAARSAGVRLDFSTYRNAQRMEDFRQIIRALVLQKTTCRSVWQTMANFPETSSTSFKIHFCNELGLDVIFSETDVEAVRSPSSGCTVS